MKLANSVVAALSFLLGLPALSSAANYTVTDLGTLGGTVSLATGINASGEVTGYSTMPGDTVSHAFLYNGTMHDLGTLGGTNSRGTGINASREITGYSYTTEPITAARAFLYDGTMHDLGTLGGSVTYGQGINDSGQVTGASTTTGDANIHVFLYDGTMHDLGDATASAGYAINNSGQITGYSGIPSHAMLYDGTLHDLGALFSGPSEGRGINASGQVTGYSMLSGPPTPFEHAFLYDGTMHDLGTLGGAGSSGSAINDNGQVTGTSTLAGIGAPSHAFLYDTVHGMVDLNSLINPLSGWVLSGGTGINDMGQITGFGQIGGQLNAFLLTPIVPEPSSLVLAAFGLHGLAAWGWRRRSHFAS